MKAWSRLPLGVPDAVAAAAIGTVVGLAASGGAFEGAEEATLDLRFQLRGLRAVRAPVAIVAVDEPSLAALGQMPWDRRHFARLLDRLRASGAAAVAFDVAVSEPARGEGEDAALREALGRFGNAILPVFRPLQSGPTRGPALVQPVAELKAAAAGFGLAHFGVQPEDAVHTVEIQQPAERAVVPTLGLAAARASRERGAGIGSFAPAGARLVLDYLGPAGTIPTYSAIEVMETKAPVAALAGKTVLVGATAAGLPDTGFRGPFQGPYAGVEIHATVAENLLARGGIRTLPVAGALLGWLLLTMTGGWALAATRLAPERRLLLLAATLALLVGGAWGAFSAGWWLPVVAPTALVACCAIGGIMRQERELLKERARLLGWYADELAREAKRQREIIDGELHDEAQQLLVVMGREARKLERAVGDGRLGMLPELIQRTLDEIIRVRKALVPHTLSRHGLRAAAEEMVREAELRGSAETSLDVDEWPDGVAPMLESELYWLLKEALNNALKHSGAKRVRIRLAGSGRGLEVEVADDGKGFRAAPLDRPPHTHDHTGLHRMWVRARGLGGVMSVDSGPGLGTRVLFRIPARWAGAGGQEVRLVAKP